MNRSNEAVLQPSALRAFLCGLAIAGGGFLSFHRVEIAGAGVIQALGLALTACLAGWALGEFLWRGVPRRKTLRLAGIPVTMAAWTAWALLLDGPDWLLTAALAAVGFALLRWFLLGEGMRDPSDRTALMIGMVAGFMGLSAGASAFFGASWTAAGPVLAAGLCAFPLGFSQSRDSGPNPWNVENLGGGHLLGIALGAAGVALLRTYGYGAGSAGYALSDVAVGFCLGLLASRALPEDVRQDRGALTMIAAVVLAPGALILESSFFFYPDLILSESAALQAPAILLSAVRTFPLWFGAFLLGICAGIIGILTSGEGAAKEAESSSVSTAGVCWAAAIGAVGGTLLSMNGFYAGAYVLPVLMCLLAVVPVCMDLRFERTGRLISAAAVVVVLLVGFYWSMAGDVHREWVPLRSSYSRYLVPTEGRMNYAPEGEEAPAAGGEALQLQGPNFRTYGLSANAGSGQRQAWMVRGNVVSSARAPDAAPVRLAVALGVARARNPDRIGVLMPALDDTINGARLLAPEATVRLLPAGPDADVRRVSAEPRELDLVVCGPGPLSAVYNSSSILAREPLQSVAGSLAEGGALAIWLPTRSVDVDGLRRVLATVKSVFGRFDVFACRDELVVLCGPEGELSYPDMKSLYESSDADAYLTQAGWWHPRLLLLTHVAESDQIAQLLGDSGPYVLSHPERPPVLSRDLGASTNAPSAAAVLQYKLAGPEPLLKRVEFHTALQKRLVTDGFQDLFDDHTRDLLRRVGDTPAEEDREFIRFLNSPVLNLDLFQAEAIEGASMKRVLACYEFGLHSRARALLKGVEQRGGDAFAVQYWRGRSFQDQGEGGDALKAYKRALQARPQHVDTIKRIVSLHLVANRKKEAATYLEKLVQARPDDVDTMLFLSDIYGSLREYEKALKWAQAALKLAPDNAAAREKVALYTGAIESDSETDEEQTE